MELLESNTFYHIYQIQKEILKTTKLDWDYEAYSSSDQFGDICQKIVQHDLSISKGQLLSNIQIKGTHGHDLVSSKTYEVKGLTSIFDPKGNQRQIKFFRDKLPTSDQLVIVLLDQSFGICNILYIPMRIIHNWFKKNPNKRTLHRAIGFYVTLAEKHGKRKNYHFPVN